MIVSQPHIKRKKWQIVSFYMTCLIVIALYIYTSNQYVNNHITSDNIALEQTIAKIDQETIALVKEAKKKAPVYINLPGAQQIRAIVEDYLKPDSLWVYVSKTNNISTEYEPSDLELAEVDTKSDKSASERSVRGIINKPLKEMFGAAQASGYSLIIGSGYRSAALQQLYLSSAANSIGIEAANQAIALPGQSEHQTGLAVDISSSNLGCYLNECFSVTDTGIWLANNSYKYGFILRYPRGKEDITGYQYEPWHFRYVGIDLATALYDSNLTLDEAWKYITEARDTLKQNGAI